MSTIWQKLAKNKRYREEFASAMLKRMIPYQARALRKRLGWSQTQLAEAAGVTQGVISRAEDPDYGNLTLTTIGRIAAGYDLAAIVKFVPFSELIRYSDTASEREFANLPTFEEENGSRRTPARSLLPTGIGAQSQGSRSPAMEESLGNGGDESDVDMIKDYGVGGAPFHLPNSGFAHMEMTHVR